MEVVKNFSSLNQDRIFGVVEQRYPIFAVFRYRVAYDD
jgi:hypothetical protein